MMDKKRSIGVTIFGWVEILMGAISAIVFIYGVRLFLYGMHLKNTDPCKGADVSIAMGEMQCCLSFPLFIFLILGIGILKLNRLAKRVNLIIATFYALLLIWLRILESMPYYLYNALTFPIVSCITITKVAPLLFLANVIRIEIFYSAFVLCKIWFFTRPKVKEQFR